MNNGYYLSTYLHINEVAHLTGMRIRHGQKPLPATGMRLFHQQGVPRPNIHGTPSFNLYALKNSITPNP